VNRTLHKEQTAQKSEGHIDHILIQVHPYDIRIDEYLIKKHFVSLIVFLEYWFQFLWISRIIFAVLL